MRKHVLPQAILLALGGAMLTGCGGGGSDTASSGDNPSVAPAVNVAITETNAQQKAQEGYDTGVVTERLLQIASTNGAVSDGYRLTLNDVAMTALKHIKAQSKDEDSTGRITAQSTTSEKEGCAYGGEATYTEEDRDGNPETVQEGDSLTVTFSACKEDTTTEINGKMVFTATKVNEYSDTVFNASVRLEAQDLSFKTATDNAVINGILNVGYDIKDTTSDLTITSDKFQIENGSKKAVIYALNYANHNDYNSGAWWFTQDNVLDVNGEVIRIDTTAQFDGQNCGFPYQGSGMIYGKNSSVKVTARSGNVTDLEIDTNGDGTVDTIKQVKSEEVFEVHCN